MQQRKIKIVLERESHSRAKGYSMAFQRREKKEQKRILLFLNFRETSELIFFFNLTRKKKGKEDLPKEILS